MIRGSRSCLRRNLVKWVFLTTEWIDCGLVGKVFRGARRGPLGEADGLGPRRVWVEVGAPDAVRGQRAEVSALAGRPHVGAEDVVATVVPVHFPAVCCQDGEDEYSETIFYILLQKGHALGLRRGPTIS